MKIAARFAVVLGLLMAGMLSLGVVALAGLQELRSSSSGLAHAVEETALNAATRADLFALDGKLNVYLASDDAAVRARLRGDIEDLIARLNLQFTEMEEHYAHRSVDQGLALRQQRPFESLVALWRGRITDTDSEAGDAAAATLRREVAGFVTPMTEAADQLAQRDLELSERAQREADASYAATRRLVHVAMLSIVLLGLGAAVWLVRSVVPRTRRYAQFAGQVSDGDLSGRLDVDGADELAELGRTLNEMVDQRESERRYAHQQGELAETLQVAADEHEAHEILQRHLERALPSSEVVVLNRNNSADRLEAMTPVAPDSPLACGLEGACPRSCLAVRFGRVHRTGGTRPEPLMGCEVCGGLDGAATCNPLLVGGEVIGSVLVSSAEELGSADEAQLKDSVVQAAPVLGNLRNLALAEFRASTDSLTGLPNRRAIQDTVKRMVAQAARSLQPLSVAMLDLDHFKQVNDTYGHGRGDDVLAALGAVLRDTLRQSDFSGRFGGEEFVVLLPDTSVQDALVALEKVRLAVTQITLPGVDRVISASFGVAAVPDHAGDADSVLRAADRALYSAKEQGRNRIVVVEPSEAAARRADELLAELPAARGDEA
jgi:diguanylate cyclase (GGDEF)-like protein